MGKELGPQMATYSISQGFHETYTNETKHLLYIDVIKISDE